MDKKDNEKIKIKMLKTVNPSMPFLCKPNTVAEKDGIYDATSNKYGAITAICNNGEHLGVCPGEFEFIEAPEWILNIWKKGKTEEIYY